MGFRDLFGLGTPEAKKDWPYPRTAKHAPLSLQQITDLTWTIGAPRIYHQAARRQEFDRYNTPAIMSTGEYPILLISHGGRVDTGSPRAGNVEHILNTQAQSNIPNDIGGISGPI